MASIDDTSKVPNRHGNRVVISGMSGLYPRCYNIKDFCDLLYNKQNPINSENKHWTYSHPEVAQYIGTLPDLDRFDAQFFKVHFRLGNSMDSMSRKMLEQTYQAIYDAGLSPEHLSGKKVGVYVGSCFSETEKASFYVASSRTGFGLVGCSKAMFANRISYWLNVKGPSVSIDEACCSSIAALEQAYQAISRGDCEAAIVGGASLCLHPQSSVHYGRIMKLCMDGKTKSFDTNADGCAKSEAINVLFLQKANDALRVYADVLHVKNLYFPILEDEMGPKFGFYRDPLVLEKFLSNFYAETDVPPNAVEYVEAFGSAVYEADKAELEAISKVFCNKRTEPLLVGSVMSNVGYSEAASGITSITKVLLGYWKGELAANLHCSNPRKDVPALKDGRMQITTDHSPFNRTYVAVNNLSVTGCNAHVLLHGHHKPKDLDRYKSTTPYLVTLSGRQESAVMKILEDLKSRPIDPEEIVLFHNIHSVNISGHLGRGFAILDTNADKKTECLVEKCEYFDNARRPLWFVYSGMGSQWTGMGAQLMRMPIFAAAIEKCQRALQPKGIDIVHIITSPDKTIFDNILHSFVGIAAVQIGLTDVLRELGLVPDKIIGHSVGELGCAYADNCFTAEEMILSAYSRGLVSLQTPFIRGSMAAVGLGYEQIIKMIPPEIEVACHNSKESSTISGPADVMREFVASLTDKGIFGKEVPCSNIAYHSKYIAEAGPGLLKYLSEVIKDPKPRSEKWVSTSVPQDNWNKPAAKYSSAEYHTNNLLSPVLFEETSRLIPANAVLVEIAPHGLLQAILKRSLPESCKHIPLTRRGHPNNTLMVLEGIGKLYMEGYNPKLDVLYPKIEFPVSTGTPMLSHLVEWAHNEKWTLPLYMSADRKTAAAARYVISLYDEEHNYLRGHVLRGKTVYPVAATLVAAWDTLAMSIGQQRKNVSVDFQDVHLFAQPVLHDQRQLRLSVAIHRGTGRFEIMDNSSKVATGYIKVSNIDHFENEKSIQSNISDMTDSDEIYNIFLEKDHFYSDEFRSIHNMDSSKNEANILWINNWVTMIDGILQLNILKQDHDGLSEPVHIRKMCIDPQEHLLTEIFMKNGKPTMKAKITEVFDRTRCGGIIVEGIRFNNKDRSSPRDLPMMTLKFVPHYDTEKRNVKSALMIFLQIVAENINKNTINAIEILQNSESASIYDEMFYMKNEIQDVVINFEQINKEKEPEQIKSALANADLVLLHDISVDDNVMQSIFSSLERHAFVLLAEDNAHDKVGVRSSATYRILASQNIGSAHLHLSRWRPASETPTTAFTVRTQKDIALLSKTRDSLSDNHKMLVLSSYPPINGLKELVGVWRMEAINNQINLVMVNHKIANVQNFDNVPEMGLAYNILDHGIWGGEYYVPFNEKRTNSDNMTLTSGQTGSLNSLHWIEMAEPNLSGINVTVHYAGLNNLDVKRATGVYSSKTNTDSKSYGMDFSGVTDNGTRVMGIVRNGAVSTKVKAIPELLWPVPNHWTMEEAATVPLAYALAFYCLVFKSRMISKQTILIHGGAGALGQAAISIALAHGLVVFTTVSDMRKKLFLMKLYPNLKESHIGSSRDSSFVDMVLTQTNGRGVNYVINCLKGDLKNASLKAMSPRGTTLDTNQLQSEEVFSFGMHRLTFEKNYVTVDFTSIFSESNNIEMKVMQLLVSEGIARGYVRPLTHVTYSANDVHRGFHLLDKGQHRGRVLLRLCDNLPQPLKKIHCHQNDCHIILSDDSALENSLINKLIKSGAKKILLHQTSLSINNNLRLDYWRRLGVEVTVSKDALNTKTVHCLLANSTKLGSVTGIYLISTKSDDLTTKNDLLNALDASSRKICPLLKYFAVISSDESLGYHTCISRARDRLPATKLTLPVQEVGELRTDPPKMAIKMRRICDALEKAICSKEPVHSLHDSEDTKCSLVERIAAVTEKRFPEDASDTTELKDIGITVQNSGSVSVILRDEYFTSLTEDNIASLSIKDLREIEETVEGAKLKQSKGLEIFFSHVDTDELLATTEMVFLPTLTCSATMRNDEFDVDQTYLCIVPGLEGHHERFKELCERIKVPVIVLQPGLDLPNESIRQMADRFATILLRKASLKKNFYLLGYESGVLVALEMASILEEHGLTGTVYCIGTSPNEFTSLLKKELQAFDTEQKLQGAVIRHMFGLMTGGGSMGEMDEGQTWQQKIGSCVRALLGRVAHSAQYAKAQFDSAYGRIVQILQYTPAPKRLQSKIVFLRAATDQPIRDQQAMQQHSMQPIAEHKLRFPLAHALKDLQCAAIINQYLDPKLLENFDMINLCETYLLNADTFMTANST